MRDTITHDNCGLIKKLDFWQINYNFLLFYSLFSFISLLDAAILYLRSLKYRKVSEITKMFYHGRGILENVSAEVECHVQSLPAE